jgi:hypothetical protein
VHALRQRLGQPICQRLEHDAAVIVVRGLEARHVLVDADAAVTAKAPI